MTEGRKGWKEDVKSLYARFKSLKFHVHHIYDVDAHVISILYFKITNFDWDNVNCIVYFVSFFILDTAFIIIQRTLYICTDPC